MSAPPTSPRRLAALLLVAGVAAGGGLMWLLRAPAPSAPQRIAPVSGPAPPPAATAPTEAAVPPAAESTSGPRWLVAGGGDVPESNQVSIEQDLALATRILGPGGVLLYASGPGSRAVQVLDPAGPPAGLRAELGQLFAPRAGRDARYRQTTLSPSGPATREAFLDALATAVSHEGPPLLVYLAGHGLPGETPADSAVLMWGRGELVPGDLAEVLDPARARETRLVVTSCYGGGFAELAFRGADPEGAVATGRCGFFATTADREAAGCDPDPDRRRQDGYGMHFLHALGQRAADGTPLEPEQVDFDGDGRVSLYEAHCRVRIASRSVDVPTSTSERWLRKVAPAEGPERPVALPEEDAVIAALTRDLVLPAELPPVRARVQELDDAIDALATQMTDAADEEDRRYAAIAAALLGRWPVLDDPWHPDFEATLAKDGEAIEAALRSDPRYRAFLEAGADLDQLAEDRRVLEVRQAPLLRLMRALENRELAARLRARGGKAWRGYERLLACEREVPELANPRGSNGP
ncbi:MAG: hypothetical protein H6746_13025 [Deltaproteobacteria bacterium]|nr:hypothetical protein [Deltaproteobacteria bacterium]